MFVLPSQVLITSYRSPEKMRGLGIVELMISITLGLFLAALMISMLANTKKSFLVFNDSSDLQSSARFAFLFLTKTIRHAGLTDSPLDSVEIAFPEEGGVFQAGQFVYGKDGATDSDSDEISIRYEGSQDGLMHDCVGNILFADNDLKTSDSVTLKFEVNSANGTLSCTDAHDKKQIIISNIENMQVLYGVRIGDKRQYVNATQVNKINGWKSVFAIMIGLLLKAEREDFEVTLKSKTVSLLDMDVPVKGQYLRKNFVETIYLQNSHVF